MDIGLAITISVAAMFFWLLTGLGLPGNWCLVGLSALASYAIPPEYRSWINWQVCAAVLVAAGVGELLELLAGALGAQRLGSSKRAMALALVGSIAGAIVGLIVGTPIPIIGNLVASLIGSGLGAFGGAIVGERWAGREWEESAQVGSAAFWGRILGTLAKAAAGAFAAILIIFAAWIA